MRRRLRWLGLPGAGGLLREDDAGVQLTRPLREHVSFRRGGPFVWIFLWEANLGLAI